VFLQRIDGLHQINQGVRAELICLSTHAAIPLKQFIGCQVAVDQVTNRERFLEQQVLLPKPNKGNPDGSLTLYKLVLQDPTALWHKRRNSRVFMNKTVIEVFEVIFKEWQQRSPLFASSLTLDLSGLTQDYDVRPFIMSQMKRTMTLLHAYSEAKALTG
jgi:type VI secretion system secreted protein VgrG